MTEDEDVRDKDDDDVDDDDDPEDDEGGGAKNDDETEADEHTMSESGRDGAVCCRSCSAFC